MDRVKRGIVFLSAVLFVLGVGIGAFALTLFSAGEIYDYQDSVDGVQLPSVDAIVVLAGGRGRISFGADVWYRYYELSLRPLRPLAPNPIPRQTPVLYLSGMGSSVSYASLSTQVRRGVLSSLTPESVVIEKESADTEENAEYLVRYAKTRGWRRVLLVTSSYHMRRARLIFERVSGGAFTIETLSVFQDPFDANEWRSTLQGIKVTVAEYFKWIYFRAFWEPSPALRKP